MTEEEYYQTEQNKQNWIGVSMQVLQLFFQIIFIAAFVLSFVILF